MVLEGIVLDLVKLTMAAGCAALMGWERERQDKIVGLRTHLLVCIAVTLFVVVGIHTAANVPDADILRIFQAIIVGIGFLGAGAILHEGGSVKGLTTASGIWVLAAIGIAIGFGEYTLAVVVTVATYFIYKLKQG